MDLKRKLNINNFYWVWVNTDTCERIDSSCFDNLQYLQLWDITHRLDDGIKYYFINSKDKTKPIIISDWQIDDQVFKSPDEFLKYLVGFKNKMNLKNNFNMKFDDIMKNKIKESQERNPELWI